MNLGIDEKIKDLIREVLAESRPMFDGLIQIVRIEDVQRTSVSGYNLIKVLEPTETRATLFVMGAPRLAKDD